MRRVVLQAAIALALIGFGWAVVRAQTEAPAFELQVNVADGGTTITCVNGCVLAWVERGLNPNSSPMNTFTFACRMRGADGSASVPCSSGRIGGWLRQ